jgi:hypothetical protein
MEYTCYALSYCTICTLKNVTCAAARWTVRTLLNYLLTRSTDFPDLQYERFRGFFGSQNLTAFSIDISQIVVSIFLYFRSIMWSCLRYIHFSRLGWND